MIPIKYSPLRPRWSLQAALKRAAPLLLALLVACAPMSPRPDAVGPSTSQDAREAALAGQPDWAFSGRLAISQGSDGGNARIAWRQNGQDFDIRLSAPITRQGWRLRSQGGVATLEGLEGGVRRGTDAEAMLLEATGWRIPVAAMAAWVRGARAAGPSQLSFDARGLPEILQQGGWTVEYRGWVEQSPALPAKVFVRRDEASIRLVVEDWE